MTHVLHAFIQREFYNTVKIGDKIKFAEEVRPYVVKAIGKRYIICTKPFNLKHTVLYTIIDKEGFVRGADNMVFCLGYETLEQIKDNLERLETGEMDISYRNVINLNIEQVIKGKDNE